MATESSDDTIIVRCYPPEGVWTNWKREADEMDMTLPEYIQSMVAAGRKEFSRNVSPDESYLELREQRNHFKKQLRQANQRTQQLEEQLSTGERQAILEYVHSNHGTSYGDIVDHVASSANSRVSALLEVMEGTEIAIEDDGYYPLGERK